ncbi:hypothetical protein CCH79_00020131 [Gambusia affinis]|uniref:Uncharacterized protein n=1 Tax=Gambusia affinis TaxID=33528 RepID=A0A315VU12_GAMAF|nr:hypothetical protein CCH79_00020131 [Gambusia affinis]
MTIDEGGNVDRPAVKCVDEPLDATFPVKSYGHQATIFWKPLCHGQSSITSEHPNFQDPLGLTHVDQHLKERNAAFLSGDNDLYSLAGIRKAKTDYKESIKEHLDNHYSRQVAWESSISTTEPPITKEIQWEFISWITWPGICTATQKDLQRIAKSAQKTIGCSLTALDKRHRSRCLRKAKNILKDFSHPGINAIPIPADISKLDDVQRMVDTILSKWGAIHIACNNAGINKNSASEDTSLEEWDQTFSVNLRGMFMCCQVDGTGLLAFYDL